MGFIGSTCTGLPRAATPGTRRGAWWPAWSGSACRVPERVDRKIGTLRKKHNTHPPYPPRPVRAPRIAGGETVIRGERRGRGHARGDVVDTTRCDMVRYEREIRVSMYEEAPGFRLGPRVVRLPSS
jgi:hypothetical protein